MARHLLVSLVIGATAVGLTLAWPRTAAGTQGASPAQADPPRGSRLGVDDVARTVRPTLVGEAGPSIRRALLREVNRQLGRYWQAPTASGGERLRTMLTVSLSPAGEIAGIEGIRTTGAGAGGHGLVEDHQQRAIRAVRLAAPFRLPAEYHDAWKVIRLTFDKRLSQ